MPTGGCEKRPLSCTRMCRGALTIRETALGQVTVGNVDTTVLRGHYLTRAEAATRAGVSASELTRLDGLVRIDGPLASCEEAYPDFQFATAGGFLPGLRAVVTAVEDSLDSLNLAGFLTAAHPDFGGSSIVDELSSGDRADSVLARLIARAA